MWNLKGNTNESIYTTEIRLTDDVAAAAAAAAKSLQSCLTVQPHRWQPTRLPCPWDSPGKKNSREESRWRRSRTGRSLSLLQIHRKNNRTVNKVYKTTSDR